MKIIIYGNSDFAELMHYYFTVYSKYEVVAFCVDKEYINSKTFLNKPLIAFEDIKELYDIDNYQFFVAVGYKNMRARKLLYEKVKAKGYKFVSFISPKANVDESNIIGDNNAILHNAVLEPFAKVGNNNIINTNSIICHHAEIFNDCFIAANSLIGGFTKVKNNCFIGFSSTILQKLVIEDETLIAAGTLMPNDSKKYTMYAGIPAKVKSTHQDNGIQLKG